MKVRIGIWMAAIGLTLGPMHARLAQTALQAPSGNPAQQRTVCQWIKRDNRRLFLCGPKSNLQMLLQEARSHSPIPPPAPQPEQKNAPKPRVLPEPMIAPVLKSQHQIVSRNALIPTKKAATVKSKSNQLKVSKRPIQQQYLVIALGKNSTNIDILQANQQSDYQLLKRKPYRNRLSLGVFSKRTYALAHQNNLAKLGVISELVSPSIPHSNVTTIRQSKSEILRESPLFKAPIKKTPMGNVPPPSRNTTYLVISLKDTPDTLKKLQLLGEKDYQVLKAAPLSNRVSLGIYSKLATAARRQNYFQSYGIASEIINRVTNLVTITHHTETDSYSPNRNKYLTAFTIKNLSPLPFDRRIVLHSVYP